MNKGRFAIFLEKHIGFGIRWERNWYYQFELSIAIMCVTINVGLGKRVID